MIIIDRRIGRFGFIAGHFVLALVVLIYSQLTPAFKHDVLGAGVVFLFAGIFAASILLTAWRCHDYGETWWDNFLTGLVPFIGDAVALHELIAKPGDKHWNAYGPPPPF